MGGAERAMVSGRGAKHRRSRLRSTQSARLMLAVLKGAALGALLTLVVAGGLHAAAPSAQPDGTGPSDSSRRVVERAVADHHCSYSGFGAKAVPASALIRTTDGKLRQVSFDVGWQVYNGSRPGTLVAVCLDRPGAGPLVRVSD
jgi:hypothetical protein